MMRLSASGRLRFRIRRGTFEVELEGEREYVEEKFEELIAEQWQSSMVQEEAVSDGDLKGILETGPEGKAHFVIPFDALTAKEAIGLLLLDSPKPLGDKELSELLSGVWKVTKSGTIRARASELHKDGKLITENGRYKLSGAGLQWIKTEVIPSLRKARPLQS